MAELRPVSAIRFYIYRSRPKIDMLYDQLFESRKVSTKKALSVKAGVVDAEIESSVQSNESLTEKLTNIEEELRERGLIGTLDEPNEYIHDTMTMRFGLFDDLGSDQAMRRHLCISAASTNPDR